jgi:hypothetical protein
VSSIQFVGQGQFSSVSSTSTQISSQTDMSLVVQIPQFFAIPTDVLACSVTGCSPANPKVDTFVFAYPGRPVVSSSRPGTGRAAGGTVVTIDAALDSNVTAVHFASPSGPLVVVAPPGTARAKVFITITTVGGQLVGKPTSAPTNKAVFTYQ